jgi:N6-L-threonylcarbamoyladenine synthase
LRVLGIESTCDETGMAVVEDGQLILSNQVNSQVPLHERFGGVVPEIASRAHVEAVTALLASALEEADAGPGNSRPLDLIAVAHRPGLIGSLLVGVTAAKSLSLAWDLPLIAVDHVQAHIYSTAMATPSEGAPPPGAQDGSIFPAVSLVVSGGHTSLYRSRSWTDHAELGATTDDAVGEAFDKVAAILGLGYPGGPAISKKAEEGNPASIRFPRTLLGPDSLDFSFSGIKTAVLYRVKGQDARRGEPLADDAPIADVAASFEAAVVDVLVTKLRRALRRENVSTALVAGGVAANRVLRNRLADLAREEGARILFPPLSLCTDNGAMIAGLGAKLWAAGKRNDLSFDAFPMSGTPTAAEA